jgi:hypothetical protein
MVVAIIGNSGFGTATGPGEYEELSGPFDESSQVSGFGVFHDRYYRIAVPFTLVQNRSVVRMPGDKR